MAFSFKYCDVCNAKGSIEVGYNFFLFKPKLQKCPNCNGLGKIAIKESGKYIEHRRWKKN